MMQKAGKKAEKGGARSALGTEKGRFGERSHAPTEKSIESQAAICGPLCSVSLMELPLQAKTKPNRTGMPDRLKEGIEALSGMDMSDVRVHPNSDKPAQLNALAYAQGGDIHLAPGQERHLPHEAWHEVQQRQGRVRTTRQANGLLINDEPALECEADLKGVKASTQKGHDTFSISQIGSIKENIHSNKIGKTIQLLTIAEIGNLSEDIKKRARCAFVNNYNAALQKARNIPQFIDLVERMEKLNSEFSRCQKIVNNPLPSGATPAEKLKLEQATEARDKFLLEIHLSDDTTGAPPTSSTTTTTTTTTATRVSPATVKTEKKSEVPVPTSEVKKKAQTAKKTQEAAASKKGGKRSKKKIMSPESLGFVYSQQPQEAEEPIKQKESEPATLPLAGDFGGQLVTSAKGSEVLRVLGISFKVTQLPRISISENVKGKTPVKSTYEVHLSIPNYQEIFDSPSVGWQDVVGKAGETGGMHITVEKYGEDDGRNPKLWLKDGTFSGEGLTKNSKKILKQQMKEIIDRLNKVLKK